MKTFNYLLTLIFSQILVVDGFAQEYREKEIIRDGDIVFMKYKRWGDYIHYQRADAENLLPESYSGECLMTLFSVVCDYALFNSKALPYINQKLHSYLRRSYKLRQTSRLSRVLLIC